MRGSLAAALSAAAILSLLAGVALLPGKTVAAKQYRPTYTLQGDSLSEMSRRQTRKALYGFRQLSFSAKVGRHYWDGEPLLYRQPLGQVVLFLLGTNDWQSSSSQYRKAVVRVLNRLGPGRCLVMASLYDQRPIHDWNRILFSLARKYGPRRMQVAGWARAVSRGKVKLSDGVHPARERDLKARAKLISDSARACL